MDEISLFVPGRLCLFGEHSDWAGKHLSQNADILEGQAIVTGINLGVYAHARKSDMLLINSFEDDGEQISFKCEMNKEKLYEVAKSSSFFSYCCGVAAFLQENYHVGGIEVTIDRITLPMKKGLSSSAAICVLIAKAFNRLYRLHMSTNGIMYAAYKGERATGSRCGRLDQACAYGERPVVMHFTDEDISVDRMKVGKTLYWVFADLCARKDTKKILAHLNRAYPFALNEMHQAVQEALGQDNHKIIRKATAAINAGDAEAIGRLMIEAQELFDKKVAPACPEELTSPVLHSVLNDPIVRSYTYGGKGVGSQGDGTVQFIAKDSNSQKMLIEYLNKERKMEAFAFEIKAGGKVKKAIVPIAGHGTRLFPETHFVKKAFMPIVDSNGVIKPVLLCILEELVNAEIEEIILVVGEGETEQYRTFFNIEVTDAMRKRIPENLRWYYDTIVSIGQKLVFVEQTEQHGFGHAVYQAKERLNDEPVLLLLGDFVYKSNTSKSCVQQTIDAYNKGGGTKSVIAVKEVPLSEVGLYGVLNGTFRSDVSSIMDISDMVEKPSCELAKKHLKVTDEKGEHYYGTFGQYILTEDVFHILERKIYEAEKAGFENEVDMTSTFRQLIKENKMIGVGIEGASFDVGTVPSYFDTFTSYSQN